MLVKQAAGLLRGTVAVTYTTPQADGPGTRYGIADFARHSQDSDCVIAVGGDGTVNIVISALARHGLLPHILSVLSLTGPAIIWCALLAWSVIVKRHS